MKYLFIVQGEGRGHLTQALSLKDMLVSNGHEVVEMLVGKSSSRSLPSFFQQRAGVPVRQFQSPNFLPTPSNKRVFIGRSIAYNFVKLPAYWNSICFLRQAVKESNADAVVNFYELLTGLTYSIFHLSKPYFCIGHQYLFLHKDFEFPRISRGSLFLLKLFTRLTSLRCERRLALSFREMEQDERQRITVVPPLLRKEVLHLSPHNEGYILGYMVNAGFADEVMAFHKKCPQINLHFFWDKKGAEGTTCIDDTLSFHQVNDKAFLEKMKNCRAYATTAGFESVCEAMYLGKPILMIPAHIEQDCNAFDAAKTGAGIISADFNLSKLHQFCKQYKVNRQFPLWVQKAEYRILPQLQPQVRERREAIFIFQTLSSLLRLR